MKYFVIDTDKENITDQQTRIYGAEILLLRLELYYWTKYAIPFHLDAV